MKRNIYRIFTFFSLALLITMSACQDDEKEPQAPVITIDEALANAESFNVGDEIKINVNVKSPIGVKRLAYYLITSTANGIESGEPVYFDKDDFPQEVNQEIVFTVTPGLVEIVIISFDRDNNNSEIHISPKSIRSVPVLAFNGDVKFRETVFESKVLTIEGTITSEFDLSTVTYQTIVNDVTSEGTSITITDPRTTPFMAQVTVSKGLTGIIIRAENIYEGVGIDTFKIGAVVDDDVNIALEGGNTTIPIAYVGVNNTLTGDIFSGSAMVSLTYAIKTNGVYGVEVPITIGDRRDEFPFTIEFVADKTIEAVRITGENEGNKVRVLELVVDKVYTKLIHFADITLTSEVGTGLNNWFAAYQAPHVFDVPGAAANEQMMDFALVKYTTSFRIVPAAVYNANANYRAAVAPYMIGFTKAPYTMVTANRNAITPEAFNGLEWDGQMTEFLDTKIKAPVASGGENYNLAVVNRRVSADLEVGKGFVIGWGQWTPLPIHNQAFGLVMVKAYSVADGVATATLEIKVPAEDMRTKYNPVSLYDYLP